MAIIAQPLAAEEAKSRTFRLNYGATVSDLEAGSKVRVWLPVPQTTEHQEIRALKRQLPVDSAEVHTEPTYGNKVLYFETVAPESGKLTFKTPYRVTRKEVVGKSPETPKRLTERQRKQFLIANRRVPIEGIPLDLVKGIEFPSDPFELGKRLYLTVDDHVRYDKSQPGYGNGDVLWVCDSRFGNCTDFHSLFIALSRAQGMPARFEIGFPIPEQRGRGAIGGYHCWAFFYADERGWLPVDISEADKHPAMKDYYFGNLTENRVTFTVGRDLNLVPQQAGEPLNFFVYPYVEVDGQPLPKDQFKLEFGYADRVNNR
jgi:transglutaminase-like putative cysteine protease